MKFPWILDVGGLHLPAHVLFEAAAYAIGFQVYCLLKRRMGDVVDGTARWSTIAAAAVGAALGSKLVFWLDDPAATWAHRSDPAWWLGGKSIVGGILGGWAAVEWIKSRLGVRRRTGDLFAVPTCVGIAIGRMGCFVTGLDDHTFGLPTSLPWGVDFGDGIPRHPTQLYEIVFVLALALVLARMTLRPHREGAVFRTFVAAYLTWRIAIDFIKPRAPMFGLSGIQWACAIGLCVALTTWRPRHSAAAEVALG